MSRGRAEGFALLEAIVAIAILASAMIPIYGLMSGSIDATRRLAEAERETEIRYSALEVMSAVNPTQIPEGSLDLGLYRVIWQAVPLAKPITQVRYPRGIGLYQITPYKTSIRVVASDGRVLSDFSINQIGYLRTRDPDLPFSAPNP